MLAIPIFLAFSIFFCVLGFFGQNLENPLFFLCKLQGFTKGFQEKQDRLKNRENCQKIKNANMTYFSWEVALLKNTIHFPGSQLSDFWFHGVF